MAMRPEFHPLRVVAVEPLTDDPVALRLEVPEDLRAAYVFTPGQHVAVRVPGDDLRRSYSGCAAPGDELRNGVKRRPGGMFMQKVRDDLEVGDLLDVMKPMGRFGSALAGLRRPAFV